MRLVSVRVAALVLGVSFLAGCGVNPAQARARAAAAAVAVTQVAVQSVPAPSDFQTVTGKVTKVMPDSHNPHNNLDHQNFMVETDDGQTLECNNDISQGIGTKVPNLQVGDELTIHGVEYHDTNLDGIHWTHHDKKAGDAGWIKTADGHIFQ